jgi:hypothetical protein
VSGRLPLTVVPRVYVCDKNVAVGVLASIRKALAITVLRGEDYRFSSENQIVPA